MFVREESYNIMIKNYNNGIIIIIVEQPEYLITLLRQR